MFKGISIFRKKGIFQRKEISTRKYLLSSILLIPLFLVIISSFLIKSIQRDLPESDFLSHIFAGFMGYLLAFLISYIPVEKMKKYLVPLYFGSLISLFLVYFFGISVSGAQRWLGLGIFSFQPSEVAKLSTVLTLALVLDRKIISTVKDLILPLLVVSVPWILIFFQPDLGTSLVLIVLTFVMLYWSKMPIEWILVIVFSVITAFFYFASKTLLFFWIPFIGYLGYRSPNK